MTIAVAGGATVGFLPRALGEFGFGSQMVIAAALLLGALYALRLARMGGLIAGAASQAVTIVVAIFVVAAIAVGLGWVSPHPGAFLQDFATAFGKLVRGLAEVPIDLIRDLIQVTSQSLLGAIR